MSSKQPKLTAGRVKERAARLEQKVQARRQRLEQLIARLERSSGGDARLVSAKERLERRLTQETEQLKKLHRILERLPERTEEQSAELHGAPEVSEEFEDIHRSFEEVRASVHEIHARVESLDLPSNLPSRMNSFEERIARREEVDSDLFRKVLSLQSTLEQERQSLRKLSRKLRENEISLSALREAAEESVVAAVDLSEKLEELEEQFSEHLEKSEGEVSEELYADESGGTELASPTEPAPGAGDLVRLEEFARLLESRLLELEARQRRWEEEREDRLSAAHPGAKPSEVSKVEPASFAAQRSCKGAPALFASRSLK